MDFDEDGFAGAGAADDDHGGALHDVQVDAVEDFFGAEGFGEAADFDFRGHLTKSSWVRM